MHSGGALLKGAFQNVGEHETEFLEFGEDGFRGLPFRGNLHGAKNGGGFALEERAGCVEKIGIEHGSDPG